MVFVIASKDIIQLMVNAENANGMRFMMRVLVSAENLVTELEYGQSRNLLVFAYHNFSNLLMVNVDTAQNNPPTALKLKNASATLDSLLVWVDASNPATHMKTLSTELVNVSLDTT